MKDSSAISPSVWSIQRVVNRPVGLLSITATNLMLTLATSFLVSAWIKPDAYGQWRFYMSLTAFSGLLHLGASDGLNLKWLLQDKDTWIREFRRDLLGFFAQQLAIWLLLSAACWVWVSQWDALIVNPIILLTQVIWQNLAGLTQFYFVRIRQYWVGPVTALSGQVVFLLVLSGSVTLHHPISLITISLIQCVIVSVPLLLLVMRQANRWRQPINGLGLLTSIWTATCTGWPILVSGLVVIGLQQLDKLITIGHYPLSDYGYYAFAATLLSVFIALSYSLTNYLLQKLIDNRDTIARWYQRLSVGGLQAGCLLMVLMPIGQPLIALVFPKYVASAVYVRCMIGFLAPFILVQVVQSALWKIELRQAVSLQTALAAFVIAALLIGGVTYARLPLTAVAYVLAISGHMWYLLNDLLLLRLHPGSLQQKYTRWGWLGLHFLSATFLFLTADI